MVMPLCILCETMHGCIFLLNVVYCVSFLLTILKYKLQLICKS